MKIVVYRKTLVWRCKLVGGNGETLTNSEAYYSKSNAVRAARKLSEALPKATLSIPE